MLGSIFPFGHKDWCILECWRDNILFVVQTQVWWLKWWKATSQMCCQW